MEVPLSKGPHFYFVFVFGGLLANFLLALSYSIEDDSHDIYNPGFHYVEEILMVKKFFKEIYVLCHVLKIFK